MNLGDTMKVQVVPFPSPGGSVTYSTVGGKALTTIAIYSTIVS